MNLNEFEQELRSLRPQPASPALESKIADALEKHELVPMERVPAAAVLRSAPRPERTALRSWLQGLGWAFAGAVLAVAVIAVAPQARTPAPLADSESTPPVKSAATAFEHTESTEELVTAEDEGVVIDGDETPLRQVHYYSLERHVWTNPHTGARMEFEIPREDVRFTPVALQ